MPTNPAEPGVLHPRDVARGLGVSRGTLRRCGQDVSRTVEQIAALLAERPQWLTEGRAATAARKREQRELGARGERREQKEMARAQRMLDTDKDGRGL